MRLKSAKKIKSISELINSKEEIEKNEDEKVEIILGSDGFYTAEDHFEQERKSNATSRTSI